MNRDRWRASKEAVASCSRLLYQRGYLVGTGGNVSVRIEGEDCIAITPSGVSYETLKAEDICVVDFEMKRLSCEMEPSIETPMHLAVYRNRGDTNAVIHTHQTYGSVLSLINQPLPAMFDEQVLHLGDRVEVVPYRVSGSPQLASVIGEIVGNGCNAFVLQNHGVLCLGMDAEGAYNNVEILERCAKIYLYCMMTGKQITLLPEESRKRFSELFRERKRGTFPPPLFHENSD